MSSLLNLLRVVVPFLALLALAAPCLSGSALAAPKAQVPGYYRVQVGAITVTALFDGVNPIDVKLLKNAGEEDIARLLAEKHVPAPKLPTAVNAYLIDTGGQLILVDTGMGGHRGPALGHIEENLRAAGVEPGQIDLILLTHMHGDHMGGLTDADGRARFPKARVLAEAADAAYWFSDEALKTVAEGRRPSFAFARKMAAPYQAAGRWGSFEAGAALAPGVRAVPLRGHTPGHVGYAVESGGQKLLIVGDLVHAHAVQFARPGVSIEFDADQQAAIATRRAAFKDAAAGGYLLGGMHLPFPGLGRVKALGPDAYAWVPVEFAPLPAPAPSAGK